MSSRGEDAKKGRLLYLFCLNQMFLLNSSALKLGFQHKKLWGGENCTTYKILLFQRTSTPAESKHHSLNGMGYTAGTGVGTALMNVQWPTTFLANLQPLLYRTPLLWCVGPWSAALCSLGNCAVSRIGGGVIFVFELLSKRLKYSCTTVHQFSRDYEICKHTPERTSLYN